VEPLPLKRDVHGIMLRHEPTTLRVLNEKHLSLFPVRFFVRTGQGQEKQESPHAGDKHPDKNNQREKA
jgi:hypothetical protein